MPDDPTEPRTQLGTTTTRLSYGRYVLTRPWPLDCMVQAGSSGLVVLRGTGDSYTTAFFEAFPLNPATFLRGEGPTVADAEDAAWVKYQKVQSCPGSRGHEFETRGYRNGAGFCIHCGMFASGVFDVKVVGHPCKVCGVGTNWVNEGDDWFCKEHDPHPNRYGVHFDDDSDELEIDTADFDEALRTVLTRLGNLGDDPKPDAKPEAVAAPPEPEQT